ncbi:ABC transporter permease [Halomicrobium sp. LC1Hm]|uniref:ABC transporter permease n=1 Tax=Halomicrobium sp. LC1Hm TaxID=2610902 RepID=UPI0012AA195E|nr:ABC transporter permease subunit [Halomicrobium sp. LC1Hm]QGA84295.1 ABC-type transport system involved in multi-copper enzyme maturation, permease component [Halomicrobium sp. LC1Hm]
MTSGIVGECDATTGATRSLRTIGAITRLEGRRLLTSKSILVALAFVVFSTWRVAGNVNPIDGTDGGRATYFMILNKPETLDGSYAVYGFVSTAWHVNSLVFLIPVVGLLIGYPTIVNPRTDGQLQTLLAFPCPRGEMLAGMYLGRAGVFVLGLVVALGVGWIGIVTHFETASVWRFLIFATVTLVYGVVWTSIGIALSASFSTDRHVATAVVVFVLVTVFNWHGRLLDVVGLSPGGFVLDPQQAYLTLVAAPYDDMVPKLHQIAAGDIDGFSTAFLSTSEVTANPPVAFTWPVAVGVLLIWIVTPLLYTHSRIANLELH